MQFDHLYMIRRHDSVLILGLFLLNNKQQQLTALRKFSVREELFTPENIFVFYLWYLAVNWFQKLAWMWFSAFLNVHVHIPLHIITCMYTFRDVLSWFSESFVLQNSLKYNHMYTYIYTVLSYDPLLVVEMLFSTRMTKNIMFFFNFFL